MSDAESFGDHLAQPPIFIREETALERGSNLPSIPHRARGGAGLRQYLPSNTLFVTASSTITPTTAIITANATIINTTMLNL